MLLACIVPTTTKLELVGDHRQLQPSVNNRYEFEQHNGIKLSMFERLIEGRTADGSAQGVTSALSSATFRGVFFCPSAL